MEKEVIRTEYLQKRKQLGEAVYFELSQKIADQFFFRFHANLLKISTLHLFMPLEKNKEPNTNFILKILFQRFKKVQVIVPKTDFEKGEMKHLAIFESTVFEENKFGIPEPISDIKIPENEIDLVLVPLLAFDLNGHRIGYGGGFYDRFLAKTHPDCIKIGLSFFDPISQEEGFASSGAFVSKLAIEPEKTDIPLDFCITPSKIWDFSNLKH